MSNERGEDPQAKPGEMGAGAEFFAGLTQNPDITRDQVEAKAQVPLREAAESKANTFKSEREIIMKESIPKAVEAGEAAAEQYDRQTESAAKVAEQARGRMDSFLQSGSPDERLTTLADGSKGLSLRGETFDEGGLITNEIAQQFAKQLGAEEARSEAVFQPLETTKEFRGDWNNPNPDDYAVLETPIQGGFINETVMRDRETGEPRVIKLAFKPSLPSTSEGN